MSINISILYFANLADTLGKSEEKLSLEDGSTVGDLKNLLGERGDTWQNILKQSSTRCALNQSIAEDSNIIPDQAELAFFPPVTGG